MNDSKVNDEIFMLGPTKEIYIYKIGKGEWDKKEIDTNSEF